MKRRGSVGLGLALAVMASVVLPLSVGAPASTASGEAVVPALSTRGNDLISVRMARTNVIGTNCRNYPVKWWVKNLSKEWPGYIVDWRLQLTLVNPAHLDEGGDRLLIKGRGDKSGATVFRMCGLKHSAGRFEARATLGTFGLANGDCSPETPTAVLSRSCQFASGTGRDRETFATSLKRPSRITLAVATCRYLDAFNGVRPMLGRGIVYRQTDAGMWAKARGADVLLDTFDAFGGREWRYTKWTVTDASGTYLMTVPISIEGLGYRTRTPTTSTHLAAISSGTRDVCF